MMVEIAGQGTDDAVSLGNVSRRTQISRRYLDQLALALRRADLLRGVSGRGGGYQLTRPAGEIELGEIVEAAIGPINIVDCVLHPDSCLKADVCECRWVYALINKRIGEVLGGISLLDLVDQSALKNICQELQAEGHGCPTPYLQDAGLQRECE